MIVLLFCMVLFQQDDPIPSDRDYLSMFINSELLDDVEVVTEQRKDIATVIRDMHAEIRSNMGPNADPTRPSRKDLEKSAIEKIWLHILLPSQRQRFVELLNRKKLAAHGTGSYSKFLIGDGEALLKEKKSGLSESQIKSLTKASEDTQTKLDLASEEYMNKVAAVLNEDREKVVQTLNAEQGKVFTSLFGDRVFGKKDGEAFVSNILRRYVQKQRLASKRARDR